MNSEPAKAVGTILLFFCFVTAASLWAQTAESISGTITDSAGMAIANATVSLQNATIGQSKQAQTDSSGRYQFTGLAAGDYELTVSASGFSAATQKVTLTAGSPQTLNVKLAAGLSLDSLGFPSSQTQGSAREQALLDKRSHMLKVHQKLGLITAVPMVAAIISGAGAGGRSTSTTQRDLHVALGSLTTGLYFTSASFAIFAPKPPGTPTRGQIRFHKALAFIHGPGMVLTPILGAMAFSQKSQGQRVHGIASAHGAVAVITAAAYGAAILSVSVKF